MRLVISEIKKVGVRGGVERRRMGRDVEMTAIAPSYVVAKYSSEAIAFY